MPYIANTSEDKDQMLKTIGVGSFEGLITKIPKPIRSFKLDIPDGISEVELEREITALGRRNGGFENTSTFLGAGVYDHYVPAAVSELMNRSEFITAYTPYQGEASQGTLQAIYEYQSLICEITGMDYSNASMYDGATALAEAVLLTIRVGERKKVLVPETIHPEYRQVLRTYLAFSEAQIVEVPQKDGVTDLEALERLVDANTAVVVVEQPNFFGALEKTQTISNLAHRSGAMLVACVNPISLGVLSPPGQYGADIAVGDGQPLGNPENFGGPHFGFFAVKAELLRKIPGRIVGMTVDKTGKRAFVLTLQAREQHIRREKATSNICTNHSLCALRGAVYLCLLGSLGLRKVGLLNIQNAHALHKRLLTIKGVTAVFQQPFFNEFVLRMDKGRESLRENFKKRKIVGPLELSRFYPEMKNRYLFAVTEKRTTDDGENLAQAIERSSA